MDVHRDGMKESLASALAQIATLRLEAGQAMDLIATLTAERDAALAIIAELREALAQANKMLTHGGIIKAQEVHNQMVSEFRARIKDLEESVAQWQNAAGA